MFLKKVYNDGNSLLIGLCFKENTAPANLSFVLAAGCSRR